MNDTRTTHLAPDSTPDAARAALRHAGFEFEDAIAVTRTLLDTFDGRLHAAGLRLEATTGNGLMLILSGDNVVPAYLTASCVPMWSSDLPAGPFRARLAGLLDVRALISQLTVEATCARGARHDKAAKTVATASLYREIHVIGEDDAAVPRWTIEVEELTGYQKRARRARDVLDDVGLQRTNGDTLALAAAAAGVELAGTSPSPAVPLDAAMRAQDGFRAVLANLADTVRLNWNGTVDRIDPEFLHDLRVAVRRSRSVLGQGKRVLPADVVQRAGDGLKQLGTLTGPVRNLDVHLIEWESYTSELGTGVSAALQPVHEALSHRLDLAYLRLAEALQSTEINQFLDDWMTWLHTPIGDDVVRGRQADRPLGPIVARKIRRAHDRLVADGRLITPETPAAAVHDLRKHTKKLRYLLECFATLLPQRRRKDFVKRLKAFQSILGEHQDAEVHMAELAELSRELHEADESPHTLLAVGRLIEQLDWRRVAAREAFADGFDSFDSKPTRTALDSMLEGLA